MLFRHLVFRAFEFPNYSPNRAGIVLRVIDKMAGDLIRHSAYKGREFSPRNLINSRLDLLRLDRSPPWFIFDVDAIYKYKRLLLFPTRRFLLVALCLLFHACCFVFINVSCTQFPSPAA